MTIRVRPATPDDVGVILELVRDLAVYERAPNAVETTPVMLRDALFGERPACEAFIGEVDGVAQGIAVIFHNFSTWTGRRGVYLEDLFVRPAARGHGLGRALLREVARVALARGCPRVDWLVIDWNEPAIGFYKALGATPLSDWTIFRLQGEALANLAHEPG
ncbi:MAG: GNAT family N-acetyltransferase [Planctomycetota bacterium]|nr:GNAT family N-acetyltransferase [Planctomycetota bacterium]